MTTPSEAIAAFLERVSARVREQGWAVVSTESPAHDGAPLAYTVGCSAAGRPELLVLGLPGYVGRYCLEQIARRWQEGEPAVHGTPIPGILDGFDVVLLPVPGEAALPLVRAASQLLTEPFETLQMVWPDGSGRFPWDPACDPGVRRRQPVLGGTRPTPAPPG